MDSGRLPVLCGLHSRWLREACHLWPTGPAEDFKQFLKAAALETETCHYCLGLRGIQHFDCCQLLPDPDPSHEHHWVPILPDDSDVIDIAMLIDPHSGVSTCSPPDYRCESCEAVIHYFDVFAPDALLHTCRCCGKAYRDGDPVSDFCSWRCSQDWRAKDKEERRMHRTPEAKKYILTHIITLEQMVAKATEEIYRERARKALDHLASRDPDETVRTSVRQAMERLAWQSRGGG